MNHQDSLPEGAGRTTKRLAVLIDADNAQASVFEALLAEVARYGDAAVKRIYGDFTSASSGSVCAPRDKQTGRQTSQTRSKSNS
jgi:hypothetical protein